MIKIKWKVRPVTTGPYRSFHGRGWPSATYTNGKPCAGIYCKESSSMGMVRDGAHSELTVAIAGTLQEAKML
jgi:hypothetical protein